MVVPTGSELRGSVTCVPEGLMVVQRLPSSSPVRGVRRLHISLVSWSRTEVIVLTGTFGLVSSQMCSNHT